MEVRIDTGTARIKAVMVTQNVPRMNGQRPNSPLTGCQAEEKSRAGKDLRLTRGKALRSSTKKIAAVRNIGKKDRAEPKNLVSLSLGIFTVPLF
jgi:hypothetical protein